MDRILCKSKKKVLILRQNFEYRKQKAEHRIQELAGLCEDMKKGHPKV
jgi:hypothetical protein